MLDQLPQLLGASMQLVAFAAGQRGWFNTTSLTYLILNLLGSLLLLMDAVQLQAWGFVLLEAVWLLIALAGLITKARRPG